MNDAHIQASDIGHINQASYEDREEIAQKDSQTRPDLDVMGRRAKEHQFHILLKPKAREVST